LRADPVAPTAPGASSHVAGWQHLATLPGGTVAGLASAHGQVFAATPAGIRRSIDDGRTWEIAGLESPVPFANVVCASPEGDVLLAGGREGLYRSTDDGTSWTQVLRSGNVLALAAPDSETIFAGTEADGVLHSTDSGRTWTGANPGLLDLTVLALALSPRFADDRVGFVATASGVYRTRNGGRSWRAVDLGDNEIAVQALAVSPSFGDDRLVLAGTEADGLLVSRDAGDIWEGVPALARQGVTAIAFSTSGVIAAATEAGVLTSEDRAVSWRSGDGETGSALSLLYVPDGVLLAGLARDGVACLVDGEWRSAGDGPRARLLVGLVAVDGVLVAADLQGGVAISSDDGAVWTETGSEPTIGLAVTASGALFAATEDGLRRSVDRGATWHALAAAVPRALGVADGLVVAWADGTLSTSSDGGATWRTLPRLADVLSIAGSPEGVLYGATRGLNEIVVWRWTDRWQRWLVQAGTADVLPVAVPPTHRLDGAVFVGLNGRVWRPARDAQEVRGGERRPMWHNAVLGDGTLRITALAVSPDYAADRTVIAATSGGVFVSRDAGVRFEPFSDGLSPTSVLALAYPEPGRLYALGLGGTVWRRSSF